MTNTNKLSIGLILVFLGVFLLAGYAFSRSNTADIPESPRLVFPINPEVTITGSSLEFKWQHADIGIDRFEFTLYKGGGPFGTVIAEKTVPFDVSSFEVDAGSFEDNQTYTWTLQQTGDNGLKSEKSFATFRVIKK